MDVGPMRVPSRRPLTWNWSLTMSAPSVASSRYADQGGAAVVLAMLVLALVASVAAFLMADYGNQLEFATGRHDLAQSRWLARGAVDWARNVLADDARTSATDHLGENWATRIAPTAVEDGTVSGSLMDLSGRFNLNGLVAAGLPDTAQVAAYKRLLRLLGVSQAAADSLAAALVDWLDADDVAVSGGAEGDSYASRGLAYRPANAPLADVDELALVQGYDGVLVARLRPFV
ncbi:MAG: general secretion pathway protein GspK, partial [Rhodocyclaceae bacterium]